jgi:hypothetical protein
MTYETYQAKANAQIAAELADTTSPFTIEVRFLGGLTPTQMDAFKGAADRWCKVIVGDLPSVMVDGEVIDDVLILAQGDDIDGDGGVLGQAGPTNLRPRNAGKAAFLPAKGVMTFDAADLENMERNGTLNDVIAHEMGHVLGIGKFIWGKKRLIQDCGVIPINPTFIGEAAMEEYGILVGGGPMPVPLENKGGAGTACSHWLEVIFRHELMSGFVGAAGNPLSRVTAASLQDMGYVVDMNAAEPFELPDLLALARAGALAEPEGPLAKGEMLPSIPIVEPEEALQP